jgi:NADH:ubiquinone oxidoreductase subunit 2 (subunit N)
MVIRSMFRDSGETAVPAAPAGRRSFALAWTLGVSVVLVVAVGVFTSPLINASLRAAAALLNK